MHLGQCGGYDPAGTQPGCCANSPNRARVAQNAIEATRETSEPAMERHRIDRYSSSHISLTTSYSSSDLQEHPPSAMNFGSVAVGSKATLSAGRSLIPVQAA